MPTMASSCPTTMKSPPAWTKLASTSARSGKAGGRAVGDGQVDRLGLVSGAAGVRDVVQRP